MPLTPQEELLAARRAALVAFRATVRDNDHLSRSMTDESRLVAEVDKQIAVLDHEAEVRTRVRLFAILYNDMRALSRLIAEVGVAARTPPIPQALLDRQLAAAMKVDESIANVTPLGFKAVDPPDLQQDLRAIDESYNAASAEIVQLRAAESALYADGADVAAPCMPCLAKRLATIAANDAHHKRSIASQKHFGGRQQNKDSCALMSTQGILLERDGTAPPEGFSIMNWRSYIPTMEDLGRVQRGERDMIDIGKESGGYSPCNGTTDEAAVMTAAGIPATKTRTPTLDQMADALDAGKAVIVSYDARPIWYGTDPDTWTQPDAMGHAVRVTGVDRDPQGAVRGFWINDSGNGKAGEYVRANAMKMALDGLNGGRMTTSDTPLHPPIGR